MPNKLCYQRPLIEVNWRTERELLERLNDFAKHAHKPRQSIVTLAVHEYLERYSFAESGALLIRR